MVISSQPPIMVIKTKKLMNHHHDQKIIEKLSTRRYQVLDQHLNISNSQRGFDVYQTLASNVVSFRLKEP